MRTCHSAYAVATLLLVSRANAFVAPNHHHRVNAARALEAKRSDIGFASFDKVVKDAAKASAAVFLATVIAVSPAFAAASDGGASVGANAKITTGGASTLQSGRTIAITRGVNLDNSDFSNQNLKGVAFQQSIVRDSNFQGSNLVGASFFDATVDGSNFEGADMTLANVEMAQFNRANLKNAILKEMYVSGATLFEGVKSIEGSDWTDTELRRDQKKYLCAHPTAKGTNPTTGVDTRESLMCPD
jgi:uncharacterized protein YjbI with pentapeptide repeats